MEKPQTAPGGSLPRQLIELKIESLAYGGDGVGRVDDETIGSDFENTCHQCRRSLARKGESHFDVRYRRPRYGDTFSELFLRPIVLIPKTGDPLTDSFRHLDNLFCTNSTTAILASC